MFEETPHASGLAAGFFFRQWQGKLIAAASFLRTLPSQPRASLRSRESAQHGQAQFLGLLERDGVRTRSIVGPRTKIPSNKGAF